MPPQQQFEIAPLHSRAAVKLPDHFPSYRVQTGGQFYRSSSMQFINMDSYGDAIGAIRYLKRIMSLTTPIVAPQECSFAFSSLGDFCVFINFIDEFSKQTQITVRNFASRWTVNPPLATIPRNKSRSTALRRGRFEKFELIFDGYEHIVVCITKANSITIGETDTQMVRILRS